MTTRTDGVVVVDKPQGMTSHDVVYAVRRALGTREVGHAGTLDPMATGVLAVLVGDATKLSAHLMSDEKTYRTTLVLGVETDSLDADGTETRREAVPPFDAAELERAIAHFVGGYDQQAPVVSALKKDGVALYERVRRGEVVDAPVRPVELHEVVVHRFSASEIELSLRCGKGFYVRSFARDLAARLGTVAHLSALRRTNAGAFDVSDAVPSKFVAEARENRAALTEALTMRMLSLREAVRGFRRVTLLPDGVTEARHGKLIRAFEGEIVSDVVVALVDGDGWPVALATAEAEGYRVARGFRQRSSGDSGDGSTSA